MKKFFRFMWKTVKFLFIVFCVFLISLFFREQKLPMGLVDKAMRTFLPTNVVIRAESVSFGFSRGLNVVAFELRDRSFSSRPDPVVAADLISVHPFERHVHVEGLHIPRLADSYYDDATHEERNCPVDFQMPDLRRVSLTLVRPDVLGVRPVRAVADLEISRNRLLVDRIHLDWRDERARTYLDGFCRVDLPAQEVFGEVRGTARQAFIRPLLEALDLDCSYPYFDGFTGVTLPVPAVCSWKVNLVNNDFDMMLDLHPTLGEYNGVPLKRADGQILLHSYIRNGHLNYSHVIGPVTSSGLNGEPFECTVVTTGTNGLCAVDVEAKSALPAADLLKIGGFMGDYVGTNVMGASSCSLKFRFPREIEGDYSQLNGEGRFEIRDGQILRMKGFKGLVELMADKVPGVSWFTDSTQMTSSYVITNGVAKTEDTYIEGSVFSIKMYGSFDIPKDSLDFTVRVQFTKRDSFMGKILHPLAWPFTKLLLEFRLRGTTENPKWEYISVIDRVLEVAK